jgi:hypothetical protein
MPSTGRSQGIKTMDILAASKKEEPVEKRAPPKKKPTGVSGGTKLKKIGTKPKFSKTMDAGDLKGMVIGKGSGEKFRDTINGPINISHNKGLKKKGTKKAGTGEKIIRNASMESYSDFDSIGIEKNEPIISDFEDSSDSHPDDQTDVDLIRLCSGGQKQQKLTLYKAGDLKKLDDEYSLLKTPADNRKHFGVNIQAIDTAMLRQDSYPNCESSNHKSSESPFLPSPTNRGGLPKRPPSTPTSIRSGLSPNRLCPPRRSAQADQRRPSLHSLSAMTNMTGITTDFEPHEANEEYIREYRYDPNPRLGRNTKELLLDGEILEAVYDFDEGNGSSAPEKKKGQPINIELPDMNDWRNWGSGLVAGGKVQWTGFHQHDNEVYDLSFDSLTID